MIVEVNGKNCKDSDKELVRRKGLYGKAPADARY
jgi:hypothetical protein